MSGVIHTDEVKHQLGDVDPEYAYFLCRRTRGFRSKWTKRDAKPVGIEHRVTVKM